MNLPIQKIRGFLKKLNDFPWTNIQPEKRTAFWTVAVQHRSIFWLLSLQFSRTFYIFPIIRTIQTWLTEYTYHRHNRQPHQRNIRPPHSQGMMYHLTILVSSVHATYERTNLPTSWSMSNSSETASSSPSDSSIYNP